MNTNNNSMSYYLSLRACTLLPYYLQRECSGPADLAASRSISAHRSVQLFELFSVRKFVNTAVCCMYTNCCAGKSCTFDIDQRAASMVCLC